MSLYITQIGKQKFVCGLFWQSLSRPRELLQEARQLASKIDADMLVLRKDQTMAQAGYAHSREGARRGQCSLACLISGKLSAEGAHYDGQQQPVHNWLGAFKLPDGMWAYCAVRDANFLPNGDFAGSKEEVLDRLHGDYGLGGWNVVVGDPELEIEGFHNFHPRAIEQLLSFKKNGQPKVPEASLLHPVRRDLSRGAIALGVAALVLIMAALSSWRQHAARRDAALHEQAMLEAQRLLAGKARTVVPPWQLQPTVRESARVCSDKLDWIAAGGWELEQYICTAANANYFWRRGQSNLALLLAEVPGAAVQDGGERAIHTVLLNMPAGRSEALISSAALLNPMYARLQYLGLHAVVAPLAAAGATPPGQLAAGVGPAAVPEWQTYSFSLALDTLAPREVIDILDQPGVRLNKYTYRAGRWSIEGVIYAK